MELSELKRMGIQAALFDMDGVLLDSLGIWRRVAGDFMRDRGAEITPDIIRAIRDMSFLQSAEYFVRMLGLTETPQMVINEWNERALRAYANEVRLMPGTGDYVRALHKMGVKLAVVTASEANMAEAGLKRNGILELFDAIVAETDVGLTKETPDIFLHTASALGADPGACVVYEDSVYAARSAKAAGMRVCLLSAEGDADAEADVCIPGFAGLCERT